MSDQPPWDPFQPQSRPQYPPQQQPYGQQPYGLQAYPHGQPQYGQEGTTGQYPEQPPYQGQPHEPLSDGSGGQNMAYETDPPPSPSPEPPPKPRPSLVMMLMMGLAIALSAAALTVSLLHAGPRGAPGPTGLTGPVGPAGPQGTAGQNAPLLGYTCQMLFPKGSSSGTETTMYWPCTDNPNG